jgi:hypothetical protein
VSRIRIERAGHVVDIEDGDRSAGRLAVVARRLWADTAGDEPKPTVERGNAGQSLGFAPALPRPRRRGQFDRTPAASTGEC